MAATSRFGQRRYAFRYAALAWRRNLRHALEVLAFGSLAALAGLAFKYVVIQAVDANAGFIIYLPFIAAAAWYGRLSGGLLAALLLGVGELLLFQPPLRFILGDANLDLQVRMVAFAAGGIIVAWTTDSLHRARQRAEVEASTGRRALELAAASREQLARMLATERRSNELRDAFNSIVSHELRTPITSIYGGAKLLARREHSLDDHSRHELITDIEAEADRLYRLVEDLLVLARSERGKIDSPDEPVLVKRIIERTVAAEQARWPQRTFTLEIGDEIPTAHGEETYVEQIMRNLLSNAAKYSSAGARITVAVDRTSDAVRVRVLDEGAGISREEARQLFELYYRSPAAQRIAGGAGIGLYVSRALVEAMGGRIWAAPRPAGGSEFGFLLRRYDADRESV